MMPFFSIIVPVYNKEKFVYKTIQSILNQSFNDFEIIIINDGSTDESESIIKTFEDQRIQYFYKKNEGVAIARNFGIEKAKGEFVCLLDADDYWFSDFLETFFNYIKKLPEQKVFSSTIEVETNQKSFIPKYSIDKTNDFEIVDFFEASQNECVLWTSSTAIHKSIFDAIGVFDNNVKKCEDTELWIRIGLMFPIVFIWKTLARYVYDENSISRNLDYYFESYTFEKFALAEKQNPKLKQYLDLNRFSAVIKCQLKGDYKTANAIGNQIDIEKIGFKKRILLKLPSFALKLLVNFKNFLAKNGLGNAVFR